jgi:hypothetical protein
MYTKCTCLPGFPEDNQLHLYSHIDTTTSESIGILISNNKISYITIQKWDHLQNETNQTIKLECIITTIHNCEHLFQTNTKLFILHIHCLNNLSCVRLLNYNHPPISSKYCMLADWDKVQDIRLWCNSFYFVKFHDPEKHLVV